MRKVRAELRDELRKEKPDKQRARTLFAKELDLRQEFREKGFRNCIENHDHSKGRCGWIARHDRRMGYGNGAWVKFIDELSKDKPNKVRAWEYFSQARRLTASSRWNASTRCSTIPTDGAAGTAARATGASAPATDGTARETAGARGRGRTLGSASPLGRRTLPPRLRPGRMARRPASLGRTCLLGGAKISDPTAVANLRRAA